MHYIFFIYILWHPTWNLKTENMKLRKVGWMSKNIQLPNTWVWTKVCLNSSPHDECQGLVESWAIDFIIYLIWPTTPILFQGYLVDHSRVSTAPMGCVGPLNKKTLPIQKYNIPNSSFLTHGCIWSHPCTNDFFLKNCLLIYSYNLCISSRDVMPLDSDPIAVVSQGILVDVQYIKQ